MAIETQGSAFAATYKVICLRVFEKGAGIDSIVMLSNGTNTSLPSQEFHVNRYFFLRGINEYNIYWRQVNLDFLASFTYVPGIVIYVGYGSDYEKVRWLDKEYVISENYLQTKKYFFFIASYLWRFSIDAIIPFMPKKITLMTYLMNEGPNLVKIHRKGLSHEYVYGEGKEKIYTTKGKING